MAAAIILYLLLCAAVGVTLGTIIFEVAQYFKRKRLIRKYRK